jgi:DNA (cytosine-5)-methyltransferase 1
MRYLSVCSGIEAATVAWHPLGFEAVGLSEIAPFPAAVLQHHYPHTINYGDMNGYKSWPDLQFDILVGGTPCQSFSQAGLKAGLNDPRGQLMLVFLGIIERYRPRWVLWENVPGVLSTHGGRDFGSLLGGLEELGYGWAYRVLNAKWFGVPQKRRRVYVVGHLADQRRAAAVLFHGESCRRNIAESKKQQEQDPSNWAVPCIDASYGAKWGSNQWVDQWSPIIQYQSDGQVIVRRLTPLECERAQGFPDNYTDITYKGRPAPIEQRYRAIGNSMAVPVMRWIGSRITDNEDIL